jgi:excisionase family DNA binding protein
MEILFRELRQIKTSIGNLTPGPPAEKPITTKQLCAFLGVTEPTIIRYRRKGIIPYFNVGSAYRYDLAKVLAALEKGKRR